MSLLTEVRGTAKRVRQRLSKQLPQHPGKRTRPQFGPDTKIEFADDFHDLMHSIWARDCGNKSLHLRHWWDFKGEPALLGAIFCPLGFHEWTWCFRSRDDLEWITCLTCWRDLVETPSTG